MWPRADAREAPHPHRDHPRRDRRRRVVRTRPDSRTRRPLRRNRRGSRAWPAPRRRQSAWRSLRRAPARPACHLPRDLLGLFELWRLCRSLRPEIVAPQQLQGGRARPNRRRSGPGADTRFHRARLGTQRLVRIRRSPVPLGGQARSPAHDRSRLRLRDRAEGWDRRENMHGTARARNSQRRRAGARAHAGRTDTASGSSASAGLPRRRTSRRSFGLPRRWIRPAPR